MLTEPTDESLMCRYCDGDLPAFKELYRRHSHGLYRYIAWRSPRQEWVDEITQDCWIALHHARARYHVSASFKTYLYQIARNRLIDLIRQQHAVLASDLGHNSDGLPIFDTVVEHHLQEPSAEFHVNQKQQYTDLHRALNLLPNEQKEVIILQQFNEMSLEEIATITDVSVETIKSRLRYAMRKLRQHFMPHQDKHEELV
jgi:RNA polymerase sigma factor (sigma-70 family)